MLRRYAVTFLDQGLLSAGNMGLQIYLIRSLAAERYGEFALWQGLSLLLITVQNALVLTPLSVAVAAEGGVTARERALFSTLNRMLVGVVLLGAAAAAAILSAPDQPPWHAPLGAVFLATALLQQYSRGLAFAGLAPHIVLGSDALYVVAAAAILGLLHLAGVSLTLDGCLGALAAAAAAAAVAGLLKQGAAGRSLPPGQALVRYRAIWRETRWALLGAMAWELQTRSYIYVVTLASGSAAVAELYAGQVLVRPVSLLFASWSNLARPQFAAARHRSGVAGMSRLVAVSWLALTLVAVAYFAALWLFWPLIRRLVYGGDYGGVGSIVTGWAVIGGFVAIRTVFSVALQARRDFRRLSFATLWGSIFGLAGAVAILAAVGYRATPFGMLVGDAVSTLLILRIYFTGASAGQPAADDWPEGGAARRREGPG